MHTIHVFIVERHRFLLDGLKLLIDAEPDMQVVGEADTVHEAWAGISACKPDVAIVDITLPQNDLIMMMKRLQAECPEVKVLGLSPYDRADPVRRLLQAGASGYILKSSGAPDLIHAIQTLAAGGRYFDGRWPKEGS